MPNYPTRNIFANVDPEILEAQERLLRKRESLQKSSAADWPERPESQNDSEIPNDSDGFTKDTEDCIGGDLRQDVRNNATQVQKKSVLDPSVPLRAFVAKAALISFEQESQGSDDWKSSTWEFVRFCRTHPKLMSLTADEAFDKIPWNATGFGEEEQLQFLVEWGRVRSLPGVSPLEFAARLARRHPLISLRKHLKTSTNLSPSRAGCK